MNPLMQYRPAKRKLTLLVLAPKRSHTPQKLNIMRKRTAQAERVEAHNF
jgi:hypothetical protein